MPIGDTPVRFQYYMNCGVKATRRFTPIEFDGFTNVVSRNTAAIAQLTSLMQSRGLFSRDFDHDEWEVITDFYNKSRLLDQAIKYNNTAFTNDVEQIRTNKQRIFLASFADFKFADTAITAQVFEDYKSKYLDIYAPIHSGEKVSILNDVDFELELLRRDTINVDYIVRLLARMVDAEGEQKDKIKQNILGIMAGDVGLRSKRELIEKFIEHNIPKIHDAEQVESQFESFWNDEKLRAFEEMCQQEGLTSDKLQELIDNYLFTGQQPRRDQLATVLVIKPKILERESILTRVNKKLRQFIDTFIEGI